MKLTAKAIADFQMPPGKKEHWERIDKIPNFYMRVRIEGGKSLVHSYKFAGKSRKTWFGSATEVNISKTCEAARDLNARIRLGQDPVGERVVDKVRAAETFGATVGRFLDHQRTHMRPRSYKDQERHLLVHAKMLHPLPLGGITRRDIATIITAVAQNSGLRAANSVRASLSAAFKFLMMAGLCEANPVIGTLKHAEKSRDRVLTAAEMAAIWANLADDHFGSVVKLLLLTGCRASEISDLRWSEVDFNTNTIRLPSERVKNGHSHVVPLCGAARQILQQQPRRFTADGKLRDLIFGIGLNGFSGWSKSRAALDKRIAAATGSPLPSWTIHDARRSWATHAAEIGVRSDVIELCLNHRSGRRGIIGVYNRSELMAERKTAVDRFAEWLMSVVEGRESNIITLAPTA